VCDLRLHQFARVFGELHLGSIGCYPRRPQSLPFKLGALARAVAQFAEVFMHPGQFPLAGNSSVRFGCLLIGWQTFEIFGQRAPINCELGSQPRQ
jgi:hypothetical protein